MLAGKPSQKFPRQAPVAGFVGFSSALEMYMMQAWEILEQELKLVFS